MSVPHKICPRCKRPAPLDAAFCAGCGRQYKTNFSAPNDQTILGQASPPAPTPPQLGQVPPTAPNYTPSLVVNGPLDNTERNVSMTWTGVGLAVVSLVFLGGVRYLVEYLLKRDGAEQFGYGLLYLVLWGWLLSFLQMRLRRLYLTAPDGAPVADILQRRSRFALISTIVFFGLIVTGVGLASARVWDERVAEAKAAETKRLQAEAQRAEMQALAAEREREAELSRERQAEWEARRAAATPTYVPAYVTPPATTRWADSRPMQSIPTAPLRRVSPPRAATVDANTMPCGHAFGRFVSTQAGGETGICTEGHQYRMKAGRWTPIGAVGKRIPPSTIIPNTTAPTAPAPAPQTGLVPPGTARRGTRLPCGHDLHAVLAVEGTSGRGREATCVTGHRFRETNGAWRAVNF